MSALMIAMVVLVAVLGIAVAALSYRLWKLRQGGTAAIMRDIPAVGGHGWRHGVIRYRGGDAAFFRLSSVRLWPDRQLSRRGVEIVSRRSPRGDEFDIMTEEIIVLELRDTTQERRAGYEIALDRGAFTAFQSWLESRPSPPPHRRSTYPTGLLLVAPGLTAARYPQPVALRVGHPAQDKQQVGQPIQILGRQRTDVRRVHVDRGPRRTLGAACRRAGHV